MSGRTRMLLLGLLAAAAAIVVLVVALRPDDGGPTPPPPAEGSDGAVAPGPDGAAPLLPRIRTERVQRRFETRDHMIAGLEMQISGEPLAESLGRDLAGYDRNAREPDLYRPPGAARAERDPLGYSLAVESYEYSKYAMNTVAFESGPGLALAFGPLVDPRGEGGRPAHDRLRAMVERFAVASRAGVRATAAGPAAVHAGFVAVPAPSENPLNTLGFGGLYPVFHPFRSFDPSIRPSGNATRGCSLTGGYGASAGQAVPVGDYECGYSSLHLPSPFGQVERVIGAGSSGWAAWKLALWIVNYLELMHDPDGQPVERVPEERLAEVGREGNDVGARGTWLGPNDLEGFQAALMIQALDDQAADLLGSLLTDGTSLGGGSVEEALAFDHASPLRCPAGAVEIALEPDPGATFPRPGARRVVEPVPSLLDLAGLLGGYAELHALTDHGNPDVGGSQPTRAYFDGDPFADDDQLPDGDATPHDRFLGVVKVALVCMDRLFAGPDGVLAGTARIEDGTVVRGPELAVVDAAYALFALRTARRSLASLLTLYGDATTDSALTRTALDGTSWRGAPGGASIGERLALLLRAQAALFHDRFTDAEGRALAAVRLDGGETQEADLEGYAAAVRGLGEAWLVTADVGYRVRAERVLERMEATFHDPRARVWRTALERTAPIVWTPRRFALVQAALREMLKLVGLMPGRDALAERLQAHLLRLDKLILNGWNDRDGDGVVDGPDECILVEGSVPRGGLQLAERALTGELGIEDGRPTADRDGDCVPEIDDASVAAVMAAELELDVE